MADGRRTWIKFCLYISAANTRISKKFDDNMRIGFQ